MSVMQKPITASVSQSVRLKVVYGGIYVETPPTAGYPEKYRTTAMSHKIGEELPIYVAGQQVITGVVRVTGACFYDPLSQWPFLVPVEWTVGPKPGVMLKQSGLNIVPHKGNTVFSISAAHLSYIKLLLSRQPDLDWNTRCFLARKYWRP